MSSNNFNVLEENKSHTALKKAIPTLGTQIGSQNPTGITKILKLENIYSPHPAIEPLVRGFYID